MTRHQYAAKLRKYNDRWIIDQVKEYGEHMPRRLVALCLIELRRRGAITRQAAAQALDLYAKPCATT